MTTVRPPFILDFAKCYIDSYPEFDADKWRTWDEDGKMMFEDRWPKVKSLLSALKQYNIYYLDAKPGNIMFEDWPPEE